MIARITGKVVEQTEKGVIIENSGIGYMIFTPTMPSIGSDVTLHTHLVIRDDAHELYGFENAEEKALFGILIGVSGVGPKTGLQMLTLYGLPELVGAIRSGDTKAVSLVPGIGKKTAEKVIIDLKDKLDRFQSSGKRVGSDLTEALLSLGFKEFDIREVANKVDTKLPIEKQITEALQMLRK
jgi:holliday junction DNA helicase RuvA